MSDAAHPFHCSISAALKHYGTATPDDFCRCVEISYDGVTTGTTAVTQLAQEPEAMARQLLALTAAFNDACEDMAVGADDDWSERPKIIDPFLYPKNPCTARDLAGFAWVC